MLDTAWDAGQTGPLLVRQSLVKASKGMVVGKDPIPLPRSRGLSCQSRRPSGPRSRTKPHLYLDGPEIYKIFDRVKARRTA